MAALNLGKDKDGAGVLVDINSLIATRLLIQATSGGGKSWALRRLLEQSHGQVQHIVLDPEGEFASLREKFDYVLVGKGGDLAADPNTAGLLARRLLELGVSAVIDLYELKASDRRRFVRLFLEAMINAPKELWHPVLVVVDEAHVYCPEKGEAESTEAVIDLCTRGRKRGFCAVLATQRLANLNKQAAAQCLNVMVGPTFLDIDRKRAIEILGVAQDQQRHIMADLMSLDPGQFYCVGRALQPQNLTLIKVAGVKTHHPEIAGGKKAAKLGPPPPPEKVRAILSKLADLPHEAEEETNERAKLISQVRGLQKELRIAQTQQPAAKPASEEEKQKAVQAALRRYEQQWRKWEREVQQTLKGIKGGIENLNRFDCVLPDPPQIDTLPNLLPPGVKHINPPMVPLTSAMKPPANPSESSNGLRLGARRMLEVMIRHYPMVMTRAQLATLSGFSVRGGTFNTYLSDLKRNGFIGLGGKEVKVTEEGLAHCGEIPTDPMTTDEILEVWRGALREGARKMLDRLVEISPSGITRADLADDTGFTVSGGTFNTYLSDLRRNGLISESGGQLFAGEVLFIGS